MRAQIFNLGREFPPCILWLLLCLVRVLKQSIAMNRKTALATGATRLTNLDWVAAQTEQQFLPLNDIGHQGPLHTGMLTDRAKCLVPWMRTTGETAMTHPSLLNESAPQTGSSTLISLWKKSCHSCCCRVLPGPVKA